MEEAILTTKADRQTTDPSPSWHHSIDTLAATHPQKHLLVARLTDPTSMTEYLTKRFHKPPKIQRLNQGWSQPQDQEAQWLTLPSQTQVWTREVILSGPQAIYMFARSVFPPETLEGALGQQLLSLNDTPLGKLLFKDTTLKRTVFQYATINPAHYEWKRTRLAHERLPQAHPATQQACPEHLWARSSVFYWFKRPILLTEVFFPLLFE